MFSLFSKIAVLLLLSSLVGCEQYFSQSSHIAKDSKAAQVVNLNKNWQFKRQEEMNVDSEHEQWQSVNLPHTPKIEPRIVNEQWQGIAWYKKSIKAPKTWDDKKLFIRFEAAMNHAEVWLNEIKIGEHLGGYLPFTLDVTEAMKIGEMNELKIKLNNQYNPTIGPKPLSTLDFNTYGGLYREVNLLVKNSLYISDEMHANQVASGGVFVTYPKVSKDKSIVNIKTHVVNETKQSKTFVLKQSMFFNDTLVAVAQTSENTSMLKAESDNQFSQNLTVLDAQLWSPKQPNLYTLNTEIYSEDKLIEKKTTRLGIRKFEFNDKHELIINGEKTFLRGVNRHQEYPHVGYATSPQADYRDAVKIKSAGFDYVRLSHYPHSKAFMDAADELGLVLIDAILGWQYYAETPEFKAQIIRTCHDLIRRDRNHASVLAWECSLNESMMPKEFIADLHSVVKKEDPNRYSAGWQLGYDIYLQARQHRQTHYETPTQPYNVSEYGDWEYYAQNAGLNQDAWGDLKEEERTSRQLLSAGEARLLQQARNIQEAHNDNFTVPAFADGYWVMFDYNRGYADDLEASGIMSIYRLPKYSYYFYQSQRDAEEQSPMFDSGPMVYIASEWTANSSTNVRVFSNADEVELWLDNELIAQKKPNKDKYSTHLDHPPFEFELQNFKPGTLTAKAFIKNVMVAQHQVTTPGIVKEIKISIDESRVPIATGVKDVVFAYAHLFDEAGNTVPVNGEEIVFESSGDIDILNIVSPQTAQGKAAVLIRIGDTLNNASLKATMPSKSIETTLFLSSN